MLSTNNNQDKANKPNPIIKLLLNSALTIGIALLLILALLYVGGYFPHTNSQVAAASEPGEARPTEPPTFTPIPTKSPTLTSTVTPSPSPTPTMTPTPTPVPIVVAWRELSHLTVVEFRASTIVRVTEERPWAPDTTYLYEVIGNIQIGIDMQQITSSHVRQNGLRVEVTLPQPIVTSIEILPEESRLLDRSLIPAVGLEQEAFALARTQLEEWAITQSNFLELAKTFGKIQLENFLRNVGFEEIIISFE